VGGGIDGCDDQQIALKAGVSKATVARVLNGLAVKLETSIGSGR
jgi:uncharacterized protein related to proFAR isomerase